MNRKRSFNYFINSLIVLTLLWSSAGRAWAQETYTAPSNQPGPAVDKLFFRAFDVDRAPLELEAGQMDLYYYNLKIAAARELRNNNKVELLEAPALALSLLLNPAPAPEGQLNPFSLIEVRRAVQHLIDREYVAREIYRGQSIPMYAPASSTDYDYLNIFDIIRQRDLRYDPEYARSEIKQAMEAAGAELKDNVWSFKGKPIRLKFVIRVEDERREIGNLVRNALQEAGFQVEATFQPFAPAIQTVYSTDPQQFSWHLYTEGWGRGNARYNEGSVNSFNAPWLGNMPGWQLTGYWQYENKEMDEVGKKLLLGNFKNKAERDQMYRKMTEIGLDESVRIWVATVNSAYVMQPGIQGITQDVTAGPKSLFTLRAAYKPGASELTIGNLWVWTERTTWNPVGGYGDAYSNDIARNLSDPPLANDPFTGIPAPLRASYEVETVGAEGELEVPADAFLWDSKAGVWKSVGDGATAKSKVTYDYSKYFSAKFHHGQPIGMADMLYSVYQGWDLAYNPDKAKIETVLAVTARPSLETIKGFRILPDNQIEVYVNYWHFDQNNIAAYATPSGLGTPWELLYAMDTLVFDKRQAAYSDTAAARYNTPWLSLVLERDARLVRRVLLELQQKKSLPEKVFTLPGQDKTLVDAKIADARYQAALDWFDQYAHLIISNGPFYLAKYDPPAQFAELDAFRDDAYPFKASDFYRGKPQLIDFAEDKVGPISLGDDYSASFTLAGPGSLSLSYLLSDASTGKVILQGEAESAGDQQFTVSFSGDQTFELDPGLYHLTLAASSDTLSKLTERTFELEADIGLTEESAAEATTATTATAKAASEAQAASEVTSTAEVTDSTQAVTDSAVTDASEVSATTESAAAETTNGTETVATEAEATATAPAAEPAPSEATPDSATATEAGDQAPAPSTGGSGNSTALIIGVVAVVIAASAYLFLRGRRSS
jgi:peptide/nickel transport system substrate-binding protein